ncbi:adenylate/guanylate cyclase domain-containing protein [Haloferula helveola]|uniref:CHASE2 domain-containing protein n=1 Tax=Haloferula helveola TaxID=490095 RepID=UPI0030CDB95A
MRRWNALVLALAGVAFVWLALWAFPPGRSLTERVDRMVSDELLRITGGPAEREDLVLLGIDEASLTLPGITEEELAGSEALQAMSERFPWDRKVWAEAINRLGDAGARLIVVDLVFSNPSDPESDAALVEEIERHSDRVVLTSLFAPVGAGKEGREIFTLVEPAEAFLDAGGEVGFVNFPIDPWDGIARRARYRSTLGAENGEVLEGEPERFSLAARMVEALGGAVPDGDQELRFATTAERGGTGVYAPASLYGIFVDAIWERNYDGGRFFRDKVVVLGPTASRFQDIHPTPVGPLSGPQLHMQAAACGLAGAFVRPFGSPSWMLLAAGAVSALWASSMRRGLLALLGVIGLVCLLAAVSVLGLAMGSVRIPVAGAVVSVIAAGVAAQSYHLIRERLEKRRLRHQFRRFVSRDVADRLVDDPEEWQRVAAGGMRRVVVLFSDVRGFTERSERSDPASLVRQLNEYLTAMVGVVFRNGGTLDKFIGDAVMAHWGALESGDTATFARAALKTAREMEGELERLNREWETAGLEPLKIGIGMHVGEVIAGELGSPERIEFGVIGDAVNLASRFEGLTKHVGATVVYSAELRETAGEEGGIPLGLVRVKGRREALELFAEGDASNISRSLEAMAPGEDGVRTLDEK